MNNKTSYFGNKKMQILRLVSVVSCGLVAVSLQAKTSDETVKRLTERIELLEQALKKQDSLDVDKAKSLDQKIEMLADIIEGNGVNNGPQRVSPVSIGGYGELHYRRLDANGKVIRELDFHRMVLFFGYEFNDWSRFVSELEVEHIIASSGRRGAVEVEQVYVEMDLKPNIHLKTGVMLMPIGIINETHEPTTFYGVERPVVEQTIIPTTWWSAGVGFTHRLDSGISYDLLVTEGLKTQDPASGPMAEPFNIKKGKQKSSFADAFDLAMTGRIRYTAVPGLEIAAYIQYQPDLDQSAKKSYAESATLFGGHIVYQFSNFIAKGLYARWDLEGQQAKTAGKVIQEGGYAELVWQINPRWGVFAHHSIWSLDSDSDNVPDFTTF